MDKQPPKSALWTMSAPEVAAVASSLVRYCNFENNALPHEVLRHNLERAAETGDGEAAIILSSCIETGQLFARDMGELMKWRIFAGESGHVPSIVSMLALCALCGYEGDAGSYERMVMFLQKLIDAGSPDAAFYMAVCLDYGIGLAPDRVKAVQYYCEAAAHGCVPAKFWMAIFCLADSGYLSNDEVKAKTICAELDRLVPSFQAHDYVAWPPFYDYIADAAQIYGWMGDDASKECYIRELLFEFASISGIYSSGDSRNIHMATRCILSTMSAGQWKKTLSKVRKSFESFPWLIHNGEIRSREDSEFCYATTYVMEQYRYGDLCKVQEGDVALCCGACIGDSSLWIAQHAGASGKVYAFEPIPEVFEDLKKTLEYNHADNIYPFQCAIGGRVGKQKFDFVEFGSSRASEQGDYTVEITTIDHFCRDKGITPTFIKMDIEGEELAACYGARDIISTHKPRMGVCLYHKPFRDFREIPKLIKSFNPDYRFYLRKNAEYCELVLLAV